MKPRSCYAKSNSHTSGLGAQWPQLGLTLMHEFPGYLETIRNLDAYLNELQDGRNWTIEGDPLQNTPVLQFPMLIC